MNGKTKRTFVHQSANTIDNIPLVDMMCMLTKEYTMLPTSRLEALRTGSKKYVSKRPCPKGHTGERRADNGACCACQSEYHARREKVPVDPIKNAEWQKKWNDSTKGSSAKKRWKERDPINAWACSAVGGAKARALKKGLPFNLDKAYVRSICPDVCPVLGTPFVWYGEKLRWDSPSLDRIVPNLGYVRGNVAVISQRANAIKSDAQVHEIQAVADWLRKQQQG